MFIQLPASHLAKIWLVQLSYKSKTSFSLKRTFVPPGILVQLVQTIQRTPKQHLDQCFYHNRCWIHLLVCFSTCTPSVPGESMSPMPLPVGQKGPPHGAYGVGKRMKEAADHRIDCWQEKRSVWQQHVSLKWKRHVAVIMLHTRSGACLDAQQQGGRVRSKIVEREEKIDIRSFKEKWVSRTSEEPKV